MQSLENPDTDISIMDHLLPSRESTVNLYFVKIMHLGFMLHEAETNHDCYRILEVGHYRQQNPKYQMEEVGGLMLRIQVLSSKIPPVLVTAVVKYFVNLLPTVP